MSVNWTPIIFYSNASFPSPFTRNLLVKNLGFDKFLSCLSRKISLRRSGVFILNFEHVSLVVSIVNFAHVIAGWDSSSPTVQTRKLMNGE